MSGRGEATTAGGISFSTALLLIFIVLKLCGVIGWSWWWVLSPLWISWGLSLLIIGGMFAVECWRDKKAGWK